MKYNEKRFLCRAKSLEDKDKWIIGYYQPSMTLNGKSFPATITRVGEDGWLEDVPVDESTVGQFSGMIDKNKNDIVEDDLVLYMDGTKPLLIEYIRGAFRVDGSRPIMNYDPSSQFEVIGNIVDNPELLRE